MKLFSRCAALAAVLCLALFCQTLVVSTVEITCDSATHALGTATNALWVQLVAPSGNSAVVRWGDSNTSTSRGAIIAPGGGQMLPVVPGRIQAYDLTKIYQFCTTGDKLELVYAK